MGTPGATRMSEGRWSGVAFAVFPIETTDVMKVKKQELSGIRLGWLIGALFTSGREGLVRDIGPPSRTLQDAFRSVGAGPCATGVGKRRVGHVN